MSKYIIKHPPGLKPWEADNWRAVDAMGQLLSQTDSKVNSTTSGLSAVQGKVKVSQYDSTAEYLEDKIVEGNDIDFIQSNDGRGAKEIKVHLNIYSAAGAPPTPTDGMLWWDTDAVDDGRNNILLETGDSLLAESSYYLEL
jgi:hypothetical protein